MKLNVELVQTESSRNRLDCAKKPCFYEDIIKNAVFKFEITPN